MFYTCKLGLSVLCLWQQWYRKYKNQWTWGGPVGHNGTTSLVPNPNIKFITVCFSICRILSVLYTITYHQTNWRKERIWIYTKWWLHESNCRYIQTNSESESDCIIQDDKGYITQSSNYKYTWNDVSPGMMSGEASRLWQQSRKSGPAILWVHHIKDDHPLRMICKTNTCELSSNYIKFFMYYYVTCILIYSCLNDTSI